MSVQQRTYEPRMWFFAAMIGYSLIVRLLPYASSDPTRDLWIWNFSPLYGICLFGATFYRDVRWAFVVPLATYLIGDFGIWAITGRMDWAFYPDQPIVYLSVALFVVAGLLLRKCRAWAASGGDRLPKTAAFYAAVGGVGLLGATVFYLVTNFGVWALGDGTRYPHTAAGLWACYVAAIPYFGRTLLSTAIFSGILFSPLGVRALEDAEQEFSPVREPARDRLAAQR